MADAVAGGLSAVAGGDEREAARQALVTEIRRQTSLNAGLSGLPAVHTRVLEALGEVPRHRFVPTRLIGHAYANRPLPIGYGQTISQPYIVALMTDLLEPEPDDVMLEVGTGSGYQAALLATLVRRVYTIEALRDYYALLRPGGFLVLTRWERQPPREGLKLFATAVAALRAAGVDPAARLAFIRSWQTDTLLARNGPLPAADIARIRAVCEQLGFDPVWFPGIEPHEVNRHHRVARPWLYEGAIALLGPVAGAAGAARAGRADAARHRLSGAGGNACAGLAAVARADSRPADHAAPAGILRSAPAGRLNAPRTTALLRMPSPTQRA